MLTYLFILECTQVCPRTHIHAMSVYMASFALIQLSLLYLHFRLSFAMWHQRSIISSCELTIEYEVLAIWISYMHRKTRDFYVASLSYLIETVHNQMPAIASNHIKCKLKNMHSWNYVEMMVRCHCSLTEFTHTHTHHSLLWIQLRVEDTP